jgi:hypothetical protein
MTDQHSARSGGENEQGANRIEGNLGTQGALTVGPTNQITPTDGNRRDNKDRHYGRFDRIARVIEIGIGAIVGVALVAVGLLQWQVYRQQANIMEGQNSSSITENKILSHTEVDTSTSAETYIIWMQIKNSGGTQGHVLIDYVNYFDSPNKLPEDFDYHNLPGTTSTKKELAPKAQYETTIYRITQDTMGQLRDRHRWLYIYGTIKYGDTYKSDHVSMYCLTPDYIGPMLRGQALVTFSACPRHNCMDNDCKAEPQAGLLPPPQ